MKRRADVPIIAIILLFASGLQAQEIGDAERGLVLAQRQCGECHAVRKGEDRSPRADAPSFQKIAVVPGMTAIALSAALQTAHRTMPHIVLAPDEMRDIIAYVLVLKRGG